MTADRIAVQASIDDTAWKIVELGIEADKLPASDPRRAVIEDEIAMLRRRVDALLNDGFGETCGDDAA